MESKAALRTRVTLARGRRTPAERADAGLRLAEHGLPAWAHLKVVAAHAAVDAEPPTRPLLDGLRGAGVTVWLPVVDGALLDGAPLDGALLDWAPYDGWDRLVAGPFGLRQPAGDRLGPAAVAGADLVVVPALAVDPHGNRLGRGGGYYDRALAGLDVPVAAVVFDDERVDEVPAEPHDVPVDAVLSPAGLAATDRRGPGSAAARSVPGVPRSG